MSRVINFFKDAFSDMKEDAKAQHEVDKAQFEATKAESKAQWAEAKAMGNPQRHKEVTQERRKEQIENANLRKAEANARIEKVKSK